MECEPEELHFLGIASIYQRLLRARGLQGARCHAQELGAYIGKALDRRCDILHAQLGLRCRRGRLLGLGRPRREPRRLRDGDAGTGGAYGALLGVQELPPREHRQEQPLRSTTSRSTWATMSRSRQAMCRWSSSVYDSYSLYSVYRGPMCPRGVVA